MNKKLFDEFDSVSTKAWKQKIQIDLKGADYNDSLIWNSPEGIDIKPFYHSDDFEHLEQELNTKATSWKICERIFVNNTSDALEKAKSSLSNGSECLQFIVPDSERSLVDILEQIDLNKVPVYLDLKFLDFSFIEKLSALKHADNLYLNIDLIGNLARQGNWFYNLKKDHEFLDLILKNYNNTFGSIISVDLALYQNSGANIIQQLAYGLAHANEYLNHYNNTINNIVFNVSVGSNYFFEIAKLRALRILWSALATEYGISTDCLIFTQPSKRNKTIYDYNTNLLRTTTESMSAILGGTNTILNFSYDGVYHKDNEFSTRIARNQLLILKHESYFNKVNNPSDGSYYIEDLTSKIADRALQLFKEIENSGGFLKQLKEGTIQRKIKESSDKEQELFDNGTITLLGTNKHPNYNDKMKNELEIYPFVKNKPRKTLIEPIIEKRISEQLEQERLKNE